MKRNALANRPVSARQESQRYWGITSQDPVIPQENINTSRSNVQLMKPDLTSHHFTRGLPKSIYKDKEQLYSEVLKLKSSLNQVTKQNVMFKARISRLESKHNSKTTYLNTNRESVPNTSNARLQLSHNKGDAALQDLKYQMNNLKKQNDSLKTESLKIKHTMKYTSLNELQIELQMLSDENKRLSKLFKDNRTQIKQQDSLINQNQQLKKELYQEMKTNQQLKQENQRYIRIISHLEHQIKTEIEKFEVKITSLQRSSVLEKRKVLQRQNYLKREISYLENQIKHKQNRQKQVPQTGRSSARQNDLKNKRGNESYRTPNDQIMIKTEQIHKTNQKLEKQLEQINRKLEQSKNLIKKKTVGTPLIHQEEKNNSEEEDRPIHAMKINSFEDKKQKRIIKQQIELPQQEPEGYINQFQNLDEELKQNSIQKMDQKQKPTDPKEYSPQNQQQLPKYQQSQSPQSPKKEQNKPYKRKNHNRNVSYKLNKKTLSEIKQLLTYRMKSQRYPFQSLKEDIQSSQAANFSYIDLLNMITNEPFYLTSSYAQTFLCYCFNKETILQSELLQTQTLLSKLRKVIDDFTLLEQDQEKQMIMRIVQMASSYPEQLHTAFDMIKNGQNTVSKTDLIDMFQNLQLEDDYIQIIIAELSLYSKDLEHLNFAGFFQRFYLDSEDDDRNKAIEEQGQESQESHPQSKQIKSDKQMELLYEEETQQKIGLFIPPSNQMKQAVYYDDNIVSDD